MDSDSQEQQHQQFSHDWQQRMDDRKQNAHAVWIAALFVPRSEQRRLSVCIVSRIRTYFRRNQPHDLLWIPSQAGNMRLFGVALRKCVWFLHISPPREQKNASRQAQECDWLWICKSVHRIRSHKTNRTRNSKFLLRTGRFALLSHLFRQQYRNK